MAFSIERRSIESFKSARGGDEALLLEIRLLHQPVREPAQEIGVRAAAFIAARPQPGVVRSQQRHAALALAIENEERLILGALHHGAAAVGTHFDLAEPAAP